MALTNPRRDAKDSYGRSAWYPYYAGFSSRFAYEVIKNKSLPTGALVVDPWNGAGTTTCAAASLGISSWGGDLNPVMVVVAKAKLLAASDLKRIMDVVEEVLGSVSGQKSFDHYDPLLDWLEPYYVHKLRAVEASILLNASRPYLKRSSVLNVGTLSRVNCFLYLVLFRVCKILVESRKTSNPTWLKSNPIIRSSGGFLSVEDLFRKVSLEIFSDEGQFSSPRLGRSRLVVSNSENLPLKDGVADLVLTSPPYCTRIDYAVSTSVELALLGVGGSGFDKLRRVMMGTTTVPKSAPLVDISWGEECNSLLEKIRNHSSHASSGYYYKSHVQYFESLFGSLSEISRVISESGSVILVVQDSQYKEIRNDLARITAEMMGSLGMKEVARSDFMKINSVRKMHPYRSRNPGQVAPVESVIEFRRK